MIIIVQNIIHTTSCIHSLFSITPLILYIVHMMQPVQLENFWDLCFSNLQWIKVTWNILRSFISQEEFQLILQPSNFLLSEVFQFIGYVVSFIQKLQIIHMGKKKRKRKKSTKKDDKILVLFWKRWYLQNRVLYRVTVAMQISIFWIKSTGNIFSVLPSPGGSLLGFCLFP